MEHRDLPRVVNRLAKFSHFLAMRESPDLRTFSRF
jgi:hypothetical protein